MTSLLRASGLLFAAVVVLMTVAPARSADEHPIVTEVKKSLKDPNKPFTLVVQLQAKDGMQDKLEKGFAKAVKETRKEKGCLVYELNRDAKDPTHFLVYERWKSLADLDSHLKAAHIVALLAELKEVLAAPPDAKVMLPAGE